MTPTRFHSIERTSPKGPGQPFIGTCSLCGKAGLPASAAREYCENTRGLTQDEALLEAIAGPEPRPSVKPEVIREIAEKKALTQAQALRLAAKERRQFVENCAPTIAADLTEALRILEQAGYEIRRKDGQPDH